MTGFPRLYFDSLYTRALSLSWQEEAGRLSRNNVFSMSDTQRPSANGTLVRLGATNQTSQEVPCLACYTRPQGKVVSAELHI